VANRGVVAEDILVKLRFL